MHALRPLWPALLALGTLLASCASDPKPRVPIDDALASAPDGVPLHVRVSGPADAATTVVFVHGFGVDGTIWSEALRHVGARRRAVAIDLPGHGRSGRERATWTMEAFGADVAAVCDELGARRVVLVGHSMGGPAIVEAARRLGGRVVAIVPVETFHDVERRLGDDARTQLLDAWRADFRGSAETMVRRFFFTKDSDRELVDRTVAQITKLDPVVGLPLLDSMFRYDSAARLDGLALPVRIVNSAEGQATNLEAARRHARDVRVRLVEKVGHFPMLEAPITMNRLLDEILDEVDPRPAVAAGGGS